MTNNNQYTFLRNAIISYKNFIQFLLSDTDIINYTYLWDIVIYTKPPIISTRT